MIDSNLSGHWWHEAPAPWLWSIEKWVEQFLSAKSVFVNRCRLSSPAWIDFKGRYLKIFHCRVMAPPSYSDIGKQARDVFGKGTLQVFSFVCCNTKFLPWIMDSGPRYWIRLISRLPLWSGQVGGEEQNQQWGRVYCRWQHHHWRGKGWNVTPLFLLHLTCWAGDWLPGNEIQDQGAWTLPHWEMDNWQQVDRQLPTLIYFCNVLPCTDMYPMMITRTILGSLNTTVDYEKLVPGLKLTLDSSFKPDTGAKVGWFFIMQLSTLGMIHLFSYALTNGDFSHLVLFSLASWRQITSTRSWSSERTWTSPGI